MVGAWDYVRMKPHIGNSDYFKSYYEKKTKRFEHLQNAVVQILTEKHVIKHVSVSFQSKIIF